MTLEIPLLQRLSIPSLCHEGTLLTTLKEKQMITPKIIRPKIKEKEG